MSKRLYFLVPDVDTCQVLVRELRELGIAEHSIHIVGNHFTPLEGVQEASFLQKTEFSHGLEVGLGFGGAAGLLGGLLAITFPPAGLVLGGGALLASALAGAGVGALVSGLVAKDIPSRALRAFEDAIAAGELLLIVDVPRLQVDAVMDLIRTHHPGATVNVAPTPGAPGLPDSPSGSENA
jgi:hypothetical protein